MIHDVDASFRELIKREALNGSDVEVVFDAPTKEWAARRNAPVLDLYLYDIREELRLRHDGRVEARDAAGRVTNRASLPRWFRLTYLVTAWTQRPEDEHRLLAATLGCLLRHEAMPLELLQGSLEGSNTPMPITVAQPPPSDRSISDVWSALGGELKPSLDVCITAPFDTRHSFFVGPPVRELPTLRMAVEPGGEELVRWYRTVSGEEVAVGGITGGEGEEGAGGGKGKRGRGKGGKGKDGAGEGEQDDRRGPGGQRVTAEEEVTGGQTGGPGRIFRVRSVHPPGR